MVGIWLALSLRIFAEEASPENGYFLRVWRIDDGLPALTTPTLIEAPEGYLWMETRRGLVRFDGVEMTTFTFAELGWPEGTTLDQTIADPVQGLWVTLSDRALWRERGGHWTQWGKFADPKEGAMLLQPRPAAEGGLYVGTNLRRIWLCDDTTPGLRDPSEPLKGIQRWLGTGGQDGVVWYSTDREAFRWRAGRSELAPLPEPDPHTPYYHPRPDGAMWIIGTNYLAVWGDGAFHRLPPILGLGDESMSGVLPTPFGNWATTATRMFFLPKGAQQWRGPYPWGAEIRKDQRTALGDSRGQHWLATYGSGFLHVTPEGRQIRERLPPELAGNRILNLIEDRERNIWAVAEGSGLVRLRPRPFAVHRAGASLADPEVLAVMEDPQGRIWAGSRAGGVDVLTEGKWEHCTLPPGQITQAAVSALLTLPDGGLLAGTLSRGVWRRKGESWEMVGSKWEDLRENWDLVIAPVRRVRCLFADRAGNIWAGALNGLFRLEGQAFKPAPGQGTWPAVMALGQTPDGRLWAATEAGVWRQDEKGVFAPPPKEEGLPELPAQAMLVDADGTVWVGGDAGLARWRNGQTRLFTPAQGLPISSVLGLVAPNATQLWLSSPDGLAVLERSELEAGKELLHSRIFTRADGLPTREASGGFQPAFWAGRDGRCWLPTHQGLVEFEPKSIPPTAPPPPVVIEQAMAYGLKTAQPLAVPGPRAAAPIAGQGLPTGFRRLEFRFTAPSLSAPEKVRFRWRLEGLEAGWSAPSAQRTVAYPHVPAGQYRFHVIACNGDGVWNETGASLAFYLPQYWHERTVFWIGVTIVLCGLLVGAIRLRYLRRIERLRLLSALDHERARIAQDIHDDLGATLTRISMWSALVQKDAEPRISARLGAIREHSNEAVRSLDQIVWAVNPGNDTIRRLAAYICQAADDFFRESDIEFSIELSDAIEDGVLHAEIRHQIVLAAREACTNALRHSKATEVLLKVEAAPGRIHIVITDNGQGFDPLNIVRDGEGLTGMRRRLASINGECVVESAPGNGTRVVILWPK
jgi:signal transduction histidine kinase/ligand-binding sensor domain-containing protein